MTNDEILRMAKKSGIVTERNTEHLTVDGLERFATLVAAAEREECAKVCESRQTPGTGSVATLQGAADAIRARNNQT